MKICVSLPFEKCFFPLIFLYVAFSFIYVATLKNKLRLQIVFIDSPRCSTLSDYGRLQIDIRWEPSSFPLACTCFMAYWSRWSTLPVRVAHWEIGLILLASEQGEKFCALRRITYTSPECGLGFQFVYDLWESTMHVIGKEKRNGLLYPACLCGTVTEFGLIVLEAMEFRRCVHFSVQYIRINTSCCMQW